MSLFKRIAKAAAPVALAAGLLVGGTAVAAHASTGDGNQYRAIQVYSGPYFNAWGGPGGYLDVYNSQTPNNDFSWTGSQFEFTPGNCSGASCVVIADYGNSSTDARAGTYTNINGAPWGSYFTETPCSVSGAGGYYIHNNHWNGYLVPAGSGNGSAMYLNGTVAYCWVTYNPN